MGKYDKLSLEELQKLSSSRDKEIGILSMENAVMTQGIKFFDSNAVMDRFQFRQL